MHTPNWHSHVPARLIGGLLIIGLLVPALITLSESDERVIDEKHLVAAAELSLPSESSESQARSSYTVSELDNTNWTYPSTVVALLQEEFEDPTAEGAIPLKYIRDRHDEMISPFLRIGDFADRGASLVRIDPRIVAALDSIMLNGGTPINILSGYRHPERNSHPSINGAQHSQHMAGRAADITSTAYSPLELAELALKHVGCEVGLGLGAQSLHIDVRGSLRLWTYEGAEFDNGEFIEWAELTYCPPPPPPTLTEMVESLRPELGALYRENVQIGALGVFMIQFNEQQLGSDYEISVHDTESAITEAFGLQALAERFVGSPEYLVFVAIGPDGSIEKGITRHAEIDAITADTLEMPGLDN